ncbi:HIT family protein [Salinicoccus sp. YB14-2]|uniref:HIT family protein n=1 Tax=Salinicoccus sp. YB14-2 TaxID=1572701 RepID=UPI00068DFECB|nr:HIT family protein [Salinicoccus sp. YB14-2]
MTKTIFEKIIDREIPANIVYEDNEVLAFMDAFPLSKGHTLVIPKRPIENIYELDDETGAKVMAAVTKVSKALRDAFNPKGLNVVQNNGSYASQSVFHLHFHLIPRYDDEYDGFNYKWDPVSEPGSDDERLEIEKHIKSKLDE